MSDDEENFEDIWKEEHNELTKRREEAEQEKVTKERRNKEANEIGEGVFSIVRGAVLKAQMYLHTGEQPEPVERWLSVAQAALELLDTFNDE